jgi:hypothetical protein
MRGTDDALPGGALRHPIHFGDDRFHSQNACQGNPLRPAVNDYLFRATFWLYSLLKSE